MTLHNQHKIFLFFSVHPRYLDDVSLHHLINALCSLSMEAMEMAYGNNKVNMLSGKLTYRNVFWGFCQFDREQT